MTNKVTKEEIEKFIDDLFDEIMHEGPEENNEEMPEMKTELFLNKLSFSSVLDYLRNSTDPEMDEERGYTLIAKHPKLEKGVYFTVLEACEEEGIKTVTYPYLAAVDAEGNELEDINFPNEAWFDSNWEIHKISLN